MSSVYSKLFQHVGPMVFGVAGPVPAGFVWVIRDMRAINPGNTFLQRFGFQVVDNENSHLWDIEYPYARCGITHWWEGHQVLNPGDSLTFSSGDSHGWYWRVSGYQLTLP